MFIYKHLSVCVDFNGNCKFQNSVTHQGGFKFYPRPLKWINLNHKLFFFGRFLKKTVRPDEHRTVLECFSLIVIVCSDCRPALKYCSTTFGRIICGVHPACMAKLTTIPPPPPTFLIYVELVGFQEYVELSMSVSIVS